MRLRSFFAVAMLALFCLFAGSIGCYGEDLYVTPTGGTVSDGASWSNAFAGFTDVSWGSGANQLGEGDTLWIAGGTYTNQLELKGNGVTGSLITIKRARATNSECTSSAGWVSAYDTQVVINATDGIMISSSLTNGPGRYVLVDGQTTDGIRCNFTDISGGRGILIEGYGSFYSTFRNIGFYGPHTNLLGAVPFVNDVRCLKIATYDSDVTEPFPADLTFQRCTFAGACAMAYYVHVRSVTVENCDIHTIETVGSEVHVNLIYIMRSDNCTIRWNTFHDNDAGVGIFFTDFGSSGAQSSNFWIYGNVFRDDTNASVRFIDVRDSATNTGPLFIYNNTFVHGNGGIVISAPLNSNAESYIQNNLFVDMQSTVTLPGGEDYVTVSTNYTTNSYALFVSAGATNTGTAPFQWQWTRDLNLVGSTPVAGATLGSPFDVDFSGVTRSAPWDIGAYEYVSGGGGGGGTNVAAVNASDTGLWLDGQEQIASSASVATNAAIVYTNTFTSDPFTETNWSFSTSGTDTLTHDGGSSIAWRHTSLGTHLLIYSNPSLFASSVWTLYLGWTNFGTPGSGSGSISFSLSFRATGTQKVQQVHVLDTGSVSSAATTLVYTGAWDEIRASTSSAGTTSFMNIAYFSFAGTTSITTNSSSGASGPTFDGRIPLSTNRHTFLNGVRQ